MLLSIWLAVGFAPFVFLSAVAAQEQELEFESSVEYAFGQELRFFLSIPGASDVDKITLNVRPRLAELNNKFEVPFEPGDIISVTYTVPVDTVALSPFRQVNYYWEVNEGDRLYLTDEEVFNYEDDRFVWQQMTQDAATIHWSGSGPFFGQDVLTVADDALNKLILMLAIDQINPFDIYVYPSSADLRAALRLAGISDASSSHPDLGVILVTSVNPQTAITDLGQSLPYELTQLLLYNVSTENFENIPWWLRDGIGTIVQTETNPRFEQLLDDAINSDRTIPLEELCVETERVGDRVLLASAQSKSIVDYILRRYGEQSLSELVTIYIEGDSCDVGIKRIFGITLQELENDWLKSQQDENPFSNFINNYGIWILLLFGGTLLMILIINSTRHKQQ